MFDDIERKTIENMGLNCLYIDEYNQNKKYEELDYMDQDDSFFTENIKKTILLDHELFMKFGISLCGLPILSISPNYWNNIYIEVINRYKVKSLLFSSFLTVTLKEPTIEKKQLSSLDFLKQTPSLKQFYIQSQKGIFDSEYWDIKDFTPLEYLLELESLIITNYETYVDINFSLLQSLKDVNLQYPKKNKTIYACKNIESIDTRYYERTLAEMKNWKQLKYLCTYCDNLESFKGLDSFEKLETFRPEITSKFKTFEDTKSKSIKKLHIYTEARTSPKTLKGLSGLEIIENIALNGLRQLESIDNLYQCDSLKELTFENCSIPNDILMLSTLQNLEKLVFDDCKNIASLDFVTKLSKLKYLSFDGNTKIEDGNLNFLKELFNNGVEIYFNDKKHYSLKHKDVYSIA